MDNVFKYSLMIKTALQFLVVLLAVLGGIFLWEKAKTFSIFQELLEDDVLIEKLIDQVLSIQPYVLEICKPAKHTRNHCLPRNGSQYFFTFQTRLYS
jgi:hypothetical protein